MKKLVLVAVVGMLLTACGGKKAPQDGGHGIGIDSVAISERDSDIQHTENFIRQRVEAIYSCYKNPKYDETGARVMKRLNLDSLYCSENYKKLLEQALELAGDDDIVLDYDHWTNSQDDNDFTCEVGRIKLTTDSTAVVTIDAKNFGNDYIISLGLHYERGNWFVDDFLSPDGKDGEKAYLEKYVRDAIKTKAEELSLQNYAE